MEVCRMRGHKAMTLSDLKALHPSKHWKHFIYLSENQTDHNAANSVKYNLTFSRVEICNAPLLPPAVYLMGMGNYIEFTHITAIKCKPHILGDIITLISKGGKKHTIIAQ